MSIGRLALVMLLSASPASAHALLESAIPPAGSEVATSPPEIVLTFTEIVEPLFSTIELRNPGNAVESLGKPHIVSGHHRMLSVGIPTLPPGTYTVIWRATSADTHKTAGNYRFTVAH
jgi:methionine-rich copper-binding protein CopC